MTKHAMEVASGRRFEFGANWAQFLKELDDHRIRLAEQSLRSMLSVGGLQEKAFLDVGSGSGLFSLAARRLGARVHSFDYDPESVACTRELRRRYFANDELWHVDEASVLDQDYLRSLGQFDIVYSWGVLHHTGKMWEALQNITSLVAEGGIAYIAIYNDQGPMSRVWLSVKRAYNYLPKGLRWIVVWLSMIRLWGPRTVFDLVRGKPFHTWRNYSRQRLRGMSPWRDVVDWVGGYPFEVAKPEEVVLFFRDRGYVLENLVTCGGGLGCNEFVFRRTALKSS